MKIELRDIFAATLNDHCRAAQKISLSSIFILYQKIWTIKKQTYEIFFLKFLSDGFL